MVKRASLWTRVRDLGVPRAFIIAVIVAIILWLAMIAAGDAALVVGLSIPVYVVFFGTAFVSAVGRSRFLPIAEGIRFLLVSGKPIKEPVAWHGPIVMNTQDELRRAFSELNDGTFLKGR